MTLDPLVSDAFDRDLRLHLDRWRCAEGRDEHHPPHAVFFMVGVSAEDYARLRRMQERTGTHATVLAEQTLSAALVVLEPGELS